MKKKILEILKNTDGFISGQKISEIFGVSRTTVWKHINSLKSDGYIIESVSGEGYKLISSPDLLTYIEVSKYLDTKYIAKEIIYFESIDSTNDYAKDIAMNKPEGTVVITEEQVSGRGRMGKSWQSPFKKGVYCSIILKPNLDPNKITELTSIATLAVNLALRDIHIDSQIRWPDDIVINEKKVCGILTEMSCELNMVNYIILGIGINVNLSKEDFSEDMQNKATSLKIITKKDIQRNKLLALVLNHFEILYNSYKQNLNFKEIIKNSMEYSEPIREQTKN